MVNIPSLRINVLRYFLSNPKLSKTQVMQLLGRNDHGNISIVCDDLEGSKLIEVHGKRIHPGRPEIFYKITSAGINYLIENSPNPG